jgi:hypothetical protein
MGECDLEAIGAPSKETFWRTRVDIASSEMYD